jgi:hypothetical protein
MEATIGDKDESAGGLFDHRLGRLKVSNGDITAGKRARATFDEVTGPVQAMPIPAGEQYEVEDWRPFLAPRIRDHLEAGGLPGEELGQGSGLFDVVEGSVEAKQGHADG